MKRELLAVIPARGGSKGIPLKNIARINKTPMIAYTIRAALRSRRISRVVVSTDNDKISAVASGFGAEVVKRPPELARDSSSTIDAVTHCLDVLKSREDYLPDSIILLQPTSPLRTNRHIDGAVRLFERHKCDAVISTCEPDHHPLKSFRTGKNGFLKGLAEEKFIFAPRQKLPRALAPNGSIFLIKTKVFRKLKTLFPPKTLSYQMSARDSVDVDSRENLEYAAFLMKRRNAL